MSGERCINCMGVLGDAKVCPGCGYDNSKAQGLSFVLAPNTILNGKYLMGRVLGQGGFGITYVAFDLALERKVAIKEYYPSQLVSRNNTVSNTLTWNSTQVTAEQWQAGRENFIREARKMAKMVAIPEIVRVQDVFYENNTAYIVMDYVEGETLKTVLEKNGPMPYADAVKLLLPMIRALDRAHAQGMIHRDISPDNIMIQRNGSPCLLDFGAAKDLTVQNVTVSMKVAKSGYSPFEQYSANGFIGPWTDVYAMCATIYRAVAGETVPDAPDRMDNDPLSFENLVGGSLSPEQESVLRDGLIMNTQGRIQSMTELAERLEKSLETGPVKEPGKKPETKGEAHSKPEGPAGESGGAVPAPKAGGVKRGLSNALTVVTGIEILAYFGFCTVMARDYSEFYSYTRFLPCLAAALGVFEGFLIMRHMKDRKAGIKASSPVLPALLAALLGWEAGYFICDFIWKANTINAAFILISIFGLVFLVKKCPECSMLSKVSFSLGGAAGVVVGFAAGNRMRSAHNFDGRYSDGGMAYIGYTFIAIAVGIFIGIFAALILRERKRDE